MKKEMVTNTLAHVSETAAKVQCKGLCLWILHEPKMPEALQRRIAEKELWKK